jgi:ABC-type bacteriocin/lantibiotic exporter with double-glycine peptidase domain
LRYYGLNTHIDEIVKIMQIHPIKGTSVAEVISVLKKYDLDARAVKVQPEKIHPLKQPFILYIPSIENIKQGHFVFCIPSGFKKYVVLDGINGPNIIALDILKRVNENISQEIVLILPEDNKKTAIGATWIKYRGRICETGGTFLLTCLIWIIYKYYFRKPVSKRR